MKKLNAIASAVLSAAVFVGCSAGKSSSNNTSAKLPSGPVSYARVQQMFNPESINKRLTSSGNSCGSIISDAATGTGEANKFLSLIPVAGTAISLVVGTTSTVLNVIGGDEANSCTTQEFDQIESQLVMQQQEINNIESNLALFSNSIWSAIAQEAAQQTSSNYTSYMNAINSVTGFDGVFIRTYAAANFYNTDTQQITNFTLNDLLTSASQLKTLQSYYSGLSSSVTTLPSIIAQITGAQINPENCPSINGVPVCYQTVTLDSNTYMINLLSSMNTYLSDQLTNGLNNGQNIVPLFESYNNSIAAVYQQSLAALQEVYHIAYLANYINYQQTTDTLYNDTHSAVEMPDILNVPGTYYSKSAGIAYNTAQENLTSLFAALVNQLYTNALGYIVTDVPVGGQFYPDNESLPFLTESGALVYGESINYTQLVGASLSANLKTPSQFIAQAMTQAQIMDETSSSSLFQNISSLNLTYYQFSGLTSVAQCLGSLESYNTQTAGNGTMGGFYNMPSTDMISTNCPPILYDNNNYWANRATVTNTSMQPYVLLGDSQLPTLTGNVTGNISLQACNPNSVGSIPGWNMYIYTPNSNYPSLGIPGTPYLMCGNWQTTGVAGNFGQYGSSYITNFGTLVSTAGDGNYGTQMNLPSNSTVMAQDFANVWSTTFDKYNGLTIPGAYSYVISGWINDNNNNQGYIQHVLAIQSTTPDGFIAPYGINIIFDTASSDPEFWTSVTPNPNVVLANVTIESQLIYSDYIVQSNLTNVPNLQAAQSYPWSAVVSTLPQTTIFVPAADGMESYTVYYVSAVGVNGYQLLPVGTQQNGNGNVTYCFTGESSSVTMASTSEGVTTISANCL